MNNMNDIIPQNLLGGIGGGSTPVNIFGDVTIVHERQYGPQGGMMPGYMQTMQLQQQMMQQQALMGQVMMKNVLVIAQATANATLRSNMAIETSKNIQDARTLLPEGEREETISVREVISAVDKANAEDVEAEIVQDVIMPSWVDTDHAIHSESDWNDETFSASKINPYANFFARPGKAFKEECIKTIHDQYSAENKERSCRVYPMEARGNCTFDIAVIASLYDSSWRNVLNRSKPNKAIRLANSVALQDYLVLFFGVSARINNIAYVSPIKLQDYFDLDAVEAEFEAKKEIIGVISQIVREEFPSIKRFDHILDPVIDAESKSFFHLIVTEAEKGNFGTDGIVFSPVCGGDSSPICVPAEIYTSRVRKYTV